MLNKNRVSNHLSEAATKGRYGDDVLVHMSRKEVRSLANAAGLKELPRNPETGLSEAWIFLAAGLALSLYQGAKGTSMGREAAKSQISLLHSQKKQVGEQEEALGQTVGAQKQAITANFEQQLEGMSAKTGMEKEDIVEGYNKSMQASGLKSSAGAEESRSKMWDRVSQAFGRGKDSLYAELGEKMGQVEGMEEEERARIESEKKRIAAETRIQNLQRHNTFFGF